MSQPQLAEFVKLKWYGSLTDSLDGEFPKNEKPGDDEKVAVVEELPLYRNFLLPYLVEWSLLSERPGDVAAYIRCVRMPHAAKYEKRIKQWYERSIEN
ncbi:hypothetical protein [Pseudoduganella chitinolytica]|uniref:Uncharacterized protein n=1 Tax=Pseudoduganella chitinolytica TaxID=34070 RepID=A0ABY8B927_9BURK|nr:hypothetical protein [Pseudoduganella chitinolytica]WEF32429.1 hypothetical protein PX653_23945 [Pseudoduganella chitinolytica]